MVENSSPSLAFSQTRVFEWQARTDRVGSNTALLLNLLPRRALHSAIQRSQRTASPQCVAPLHLSHTTNKRQRFGALNTEAILCLHRAQVLSGSVGSWLVFAGRESLERVVNARNRSRGWWLQESIH